jgi:hypothetical protein
MLLAPGSHQSLKALSSLVLIDSERKKDLTQREIENMDRLLYQDPIRFRKYALRDTEVTLKVFMVMQSLLNELTFGGFKKYFKTLGSASVTALLEHYAKHGIDRILNHPPGKNSGLPPKELKIQVERYEKSLRFVKACYHGGRNEAFFWGDTSRFELSGNRLFLDCDFQSAYPSAMALAIRIDLTKDPIHARAYQMITKNLINRLNLNLAWSQRKELKKLYGRNFPWNDQFKSFGDDSNSLESVFGIRGNHIQI